MSETYTDLYNKALNLVKTGSFIQARDLLLELFKSNNENPELLHLLGVVENQLNNLEQAETFFLTSIKFSLKPQAMCYSNLAETFRKKGNAEKAIEALKKAIEINPNFHVAKYNLANIFKSLGNFNQAIELYDQAIKLDSSNYQYHYNLANCFFEIGNYDLSIQAYNATLILKPNLKDVYYNIGYLYENKNDLHNAILNYQRLIEKNPTHKDAYKRIAICYETLGKVSKSIFYYKKYLSLDPQNIGISVHLDFMTEFIFFSSKEITSYRNKVFDHINKYYRTVTVDVINDFFSNIPPFVYHGTNNKEIKEKYASIFQKYSFKYEKKYEPKNKIRLGFFVSHGNEDIFANLMTSLINNISEIDFEVFIITTTQRSQLKLANFFNNSYLKYTRAPKTFLDLVDIVKETSFDIIYHWEVGTSFVNYFLPLFKLAPIQCTSLGLPETTGIKEMDYFISHKLMETDNSDTHYTEKLIKMENLPLFYNKIKISKYYSKEYFNLNENYNIYSCFQNLKKIHPDFDLLLKGILEKDEKALIFFVEDVYESITETLQCRFRSNLSEYYDRIIFLPRLSYQEYLNFINYSDVILDTFYFCGGNTSVDALSIGTPIVTFPSELQRSRFTYALYKMLGIDDCIATSFSDYVDIAIKIASNKKLRNDISEKIKKRNHIIFDNQDAKLKEMESIFKKMVIEINS